MESEVDTYELIKYCNQLKFAYVYYFILFIFTYCYYFSFDNLQDTVIKQGKEINTLKGNVEHDDSHTSVHEIEDTTTA
jgi:hypothetical protein